MPRFLLLFLLASAGCRATVPTSAAHVESGVSVGDSFIRVVARPELYDGKRVQLVGYMNLEFEGNALYPSEEAWLHGQTADALWIDVEGMTAQPPFPRGWVLIEATFNGERHGHFGLFAGTLEHVTRMAASR